MLKIKSKIKKLSLVVALGLLSSTASAVTLHSTLEYITSESVGLNIGDWAAARISVDAGNCPAGCDVTGASLYASDHDSFFGDSASLEGMTLSVYADGGDGRSVGSKIFDFVNPALIPGGGIEKISFSVADGLDTFLSNTNHPYYWLRFENVSRENGIGWSYDGFAAGEYQLSYEAGQDFEFADLPFIFDVTGVPATASPVPVPGAVWMMGSGLFGLLAVSRRKSNKLA